MNNSDVSKIFTNIKINLVKGYKNKKSFFEINFIYNNSNKNDFLNDISFNIYYNEIELLKTKIINEMVELKLIKLEHKKKIADILYKKLKNKINEIRIIKKVGRFDIIDMNFEKNNYLN